MITTILKLKKFIYWAIWITRWAKPWTLCGQEYDVQTPVLVLLSKLAQIKQYSRFLEWTTEMIKICVLVFCPPSPGLCQRSEPADVAVSRAMWGARPFQGAHDWAVWLPQVQLSLQEGEQVRQHHHVLALWRHICVSFSITFIYPGKILLILRTSFSREPWPKVTLVDIRTMIVLLVCFDGFFFFMLTHIYEDPLRTLTISPLNFQVLSLLQHGSPKPECDVRAGESGCGAHRLLGSKHIFGWWDRGPARYQRKLF